MFDVPSSVKGCQRPHLNLLKAAFERGETYPGYPSFDNRLFAALETLEQSADGRLVVPDGPWNLEDGSDTALPTPKEQEKFAAQGLDLDLRGRPLHPWLGSMVGDAALGSLFGKGAYWRWGASLTVDSIIELNDHVLLIERGDTGTTALPGGFIDKGETPLLAAIRETFEETDLVLTAIGKCIYRGPVADLRMTANAWPATTAYHFNLGHSDKLPKVRGKDDARRARWIPIEEALDAELFGSHHFLLSKALDKDA
ncbi:MAG TPA: NUDIX domain-containing protein [Candidatus Saccharimonadales bacterium]